MQLGGYKVCKNIFTLFDLQSNIVPLQFCALQISKHSSVIMYLLRRLKNDRNFLNGNNDIESQPHHYRKSLCLLKAL